MLILENSTFYMRMCTSEEPSYYRYYVELYIFMEQEIVNVFLISDIPRSLMATCIPLDEHRWICWLRTQALAACPSVPTPRLLLTGLILSTLMNNSCLCFLTCESRKHMGLF